MILSKENISVAEYKEISVIFERYLYGTEGHFNRYLMKAIGKADLGNRNLLRKGFPEVIALYERYISGE